MAQYVTMVDEVLSGWGESKDKLNILAIEVENDEEADTVAERAYDRPSL